MIEKRITIISFVAIAVISLTITSSYGGIIFSADTDLDTISNDIDNCPNTANPLQENYDNDSFGNLCDPDDDNDKVLDEIDAFDTDPTEWADFDGDTIGDNADIDDDNDKIIDMIDAFDTDPTEWADFDFDGIGKTQDLDDDDDGINDEKDDYPILIAEEMTTKYLQNIQDCAIMDDGTSRLLCFAQFFGKVTENEKNNSNALELSIVLAKLGAIDDCHFVSHEVGHVAFEENSDVIENLIGMDGSMCRGGYFHGVLASYFHEIEESGEPFPSNHNTICDELIGSPNYQDCIHGLGHGLVHYYGDELNSSVEKCHDMSFYQNRLCMKGVMMQYTDNTLTRQGISKDVLSNLCVQSELGEIDFQECNMSIGSTLAFFTNHDFDEGEQSCKLIDGEDAQKFCLDGLRLEIEDSETYEKNPLTQEIREKYQPQFIENSSKIIDIRSPAVISNFDFNPQAGTMLFSIDRPQYVLLYIPNEFLAPKMVVAVNGQIPSKLDVQNNVFGDEITMIFFVPSNAGMVVISPVP